MKKEPWRKNQAEIKEEAPEKLAHFEDLTVGSYSNITLAHKSLTTFLLEWGRSLENSVGSDKLPTPITCALFEPKLSIDVDAKNDEGNGNCDFIPMQTLLREDPEEVIKTSRVKISFRKQSGIQLETNNAVWKRV